MDPILEQVGEPEPSDDRGCRWWCACGRSRRQPYCDGAHRAAGISPVHVEVSEPGKGWYCAGARLRSWCDEAHESI